MDRPRDDYIVEKSTAIVIFPMIVIGTIIGFAMEILK